MIKPFKVNMLTGLVMSIVLLGVISASMTLVTTGVYRDLTFDFQRDYMTQLVSMRAQDILDEQSADAARLGLRIQGMASFRQAFHAGDAGRLRAELEDQFRQGIITANIVRVLKLHAFDAAFEPLAEAYNQPSAPGASASICCGQFGSAGGVSSPSGSKRTALESPGNVASSTSLVVSPCTRAPTYLSPSRASVSPTTLPHPALGKCESNGSLNAPPLSPCVMAQP